MNLYVMKFLKKYSQITSVNLVPKSQLQKKFLANDRKNN